MDREKIVKITEEGGAKGKKWWRRRRCQLGADNLRGCGSAVRNRAVSSKQRFLYPVLGGG